MIQTDSIEKSSVSFRVLTDGQIVEIRRTAFEVMSKVGFRVHHEGARKMLKQAGALVDDEIVKVPEHIVAECLRTAPKGWTIYDREGKRAMEVEGRKSYYGTSTASPNTKDALSGEIHPTRVADIATGAKVADALANIDWVIINSTARCANLASASNRSSRPTSSISVAIRSLVKADCSARSRSASWPAFVTSIWLWSSKTRQVVGNAG